MAPVMLGVLVGALLLLGVCGAPNAKTDTKFELEGIDNFGVLFNREVERDGGYDIEVVEDPGYLVERGVTIIITIECEWGIRWKVIHYKKRIGWSFASITIKIWFKIPIPFFRCKVSIQITFGHPHYVTHDGTAFDFHGTCNYVLAETCDASVPQFRILSENFYASEAQRQKKVSSPKNVWVEVYGQRIIMGAGGRVVLNGIERILPIFIGDQTQFVEVHEEPGAIVLTTDFYLMVELGGFNRVYISIPQQFQGKLCGMLGDFDGDPNNDFKLPGGTITADEQVFGNSWKDVALSSPTCEDGVAVNVACVDPAEQNQVDSDCSGLSDPNGSFKDCHVVLSPDQFEDNCRFDMCADFGNTDFLCNMYESYARQCAIRGVIVAWRSPSFCPVDCGKNAHFELSVPPCSNSCTDPTAETMCAADNTLVPVSGCVCDTGYIRSGMQCVLPADCGCSGPNGVYYKKGDVWFESCTSRGTCNGPDDAQFDSMPGCPSDMDCVLQPDGSYTCVCQQTPGSTPECAKSCTVSQTGLLNTPMALSTHLPPNTKVTLARTDSSQSEQCKVKVVALTDSQGNVNWAAVSTGVHPRANKQHKYGRNFAFDLWANEGVFMRGPKLNNLVQVTFPFAGWNDGSVYVTINEIPGGGWRLIATCGTGAGAEHLLTFSYASTLPGVEYIELNVSKPQEWTEICYDI